MREFLQSIGYDGWILPALLLIPLAGALLIWTIGWVSTHDASIAQVKSARWIAFLALLAEFIVSAGLWWSFDPSARGWQARFVMPWIPQWGANISMGIDGISLFMILLTTLLMPLSVLGSWTSVR